MITPSYSATATERVLPRMALDFTTGVLDPRVTVTRALNTATRVNSSGFIEVVNADLPRFDYSPTTLSPKGLLIEEQRANLLLQSNGFATTWAWASGSAGTITQDAVSPEGTANAWTIADTSISVAQIIQQSVNLTAVNHTFSCYFKKTTGAQSTYPVMLVVNGGNLNGAVCTVDTTNGVATVWTAFTGWTIVTSTATCVDAGDYWRVSLTFLGQSAGFFIRIAPAATTNATQSTGTLTTNLTGSTVIYGAQLEVGAFATSYIPTTTTSLTRNADVVSMTGTNFSSWFNANEGTFVATTSVLNLAANRPIMQTTTGGLANGSQYVYYNPSSSRFGYRVYDATGTAVGAVNYTNAGTPVINTTYGAAIGYKTDSFAISVNGAAVGLDTLGTVTGAADAILIGGDTGPTYLNGHAKSLRFYPLRLTNAETQAFSKG